MLPCAINSLFLLLIINFIQFSAGFRINSPSFPQQFGDGIQLRRRANNSSSANGIGVLDNLSNTQYLTNITVGGTQFQVIIDTGSADLWVFGVPQVTTSLNVASSIQYAVGDAKGTINTAPVNFLGYNISDQAYLLVNDTSAFSSNLPAEGIFGIVGLGPSSGSVIRNTIGNASADPVLDRIFSQNASASNYITFYLNRANDASQTQNGEITIMSIIPGLENVTAQTQVPAERLKTDSAFNQHWTIQLDPQGIFGPDGKFIKKSSIVPDNEGRLYGVIDSGFTLPQVPRSVSDSIYGRVRGANYSVEKNLWTFPCEQELNISFSIGGYRYPIHPLDTSSKELGFNDANGNFVCVGTFQPITSAFSLAGQFDLILGMAFLRNTYALLNYGNFIENGDSSAAPYVQLQSTTNPAQAHQDFVTERLGGIDTSGSSQYSLLPPGQGKTSPVPLDERVTHAEQKVIRYMPEIVTVCIAIVLALLGYGTWVFIRRRRARRAALAKSEMRVSIGKGYNTLQEPIEPPIHLRNLESGGGYRGSYSKQYGY